MSMDIENIWGGTQTLTQISKWKKGHNSNKMLATVAYSCLYIEVMLVNKYAKYKRNMSMDFENILGGTQTLTQIYQ